MTRDVYVPPDGPPQAAPLSRAIYAAMGEENIFQMLEDFDAECNNPTTNRVHVSSS